MPAQTPWRRPSFVLANLFTGGAMCTGTPIICFTKSFQRRRTQLLFSFQPLDNDSCKFQWVSMAWRNNGHSSGCQMKLWLHQLNNALWTHHHFYILGMKTNFKLVNLQGLFSLDHRPVAHCRPIFICYVVNLLRAHLISKPESWGNFSFDSL